MNELALSNDINVITAEINSYKQVAGQAIFEIGKRLIHVKKKDLAHGDFGKWLESIEIDWNTANRFMKIAKELDSNSDTYQNLGWQAMYLISTLPEEEREKSHTIPSTGEEKQLHEMTVKELQEVKTELKKAKTELSKSEKDKKRIEAEKNRLGQLYNEERNRKPEVVEVERFKEVRVEVMPEEKEKQLSKYEQDIKTYKDTLEALNDEKQMLEEKVAQWEEVDTLDAKKQKLEIEKHISIYEMQIKIKKFLEDAAPSLFLQGAIASSDPIIKKALYENALALEGFTETLKVIIRSEIEYENAEYTEIT